MVVLDVRVPGLGRSALERFLAEASREAGLVGEVTVLITTSRELAGLNRRFRRRNRPTDVLSFPSATEDGGDIAVSADIAAESARRFGHTVGDELRILILHGVLHLAGYDHESDKGEMSAVEARLRERFRLPVALIERTSATARTRARAKSPVARSKTSRSVKKASKRKSVR